MGRPTLVAERTEHILRAFARCIARHGVTATTLEHVAQEAGLARGHVRHYVGNREQLERLLFDRMVDRYVARAKDLIRTAPPGRRALAMILDLFEPETEDDPYAQAVDAVLENARVNAGVRERVFAVYASLETALAEALAEDIPGRPEALYRDTAYPLLALMFGHWSLGALGFPSNRRAGALQQAQRMIEALRA